MAKRVLVLVGVSLAVLFQFFWKLDNADAQGPSTNSTPYTNLIIEIAQTVTNNDFGPVWQNVWTIYGTNGSVAVFAQTNTSIRTFWAPFSNVTTGDATDSVSTTESTTFYSEVVSNPPYCGDPYNLDSDNDGLPDSVENMLNTDPNNPDSDGDGYTDLQEVVLGSDPFSACNHPAIPPFLAAWWTFDDGTSTLTTDASGNLQTGVLEGTPNPTWVTNGVANGALSFDGSNAFLVTPATAMFCNLTTQLTVSAWINPLNQFFNGGPPLVKWNGYADDQFGYSDDADACGFTLEFHDPSNVWFLVYSSDLSNWISTPLAAVSTNQWTYLTATYDGSAIRLFTNGVLAGTTTTNIGNMTTCGTDLSIANDLVNFNRYYHGLIDDVRIYYTALGTADVYAVYKMDTDHDGLANIDEINLYHTNPNLFDSDSDGYSDGQEITLGSNPTNSASTPAGVPPYLLGWWKFLDDTGSFDADSSSNHMGGGVVGSPTWLGSGIFGGALQFDGGTEYATNPPTTLAVLTTQLTVAVWINAPAQGSTSASPLTKWNECTEEGDIGGFTMEFSGSTNVLFYLYSTSAQNWIPVGPAAINTNSWTHLAATYDGADLRIYQNGVAIGSPVAFTDSVNYCVTPLAVAHDLVNGGRYLTGQLADVRAYNKALGSNDVSAIYNTDSIGDGIPNWWRQEYFGNGTTTNAYSCASCTSTNPFAHGLTNLQLHENPSVLISNNYTTLNDGIPDWWRVMYFSTSTTTNSSSCATCDPDGDGFNNLQEYQNATDPLVFNGITVPVVVASGSSSNSASVTDVGSGGTYTWSINNGTVDSGQGTPNISWTAGDPGSAAISVSMQASGGTSFNLSGLTALTACSTQPVISVASAVAAGSTNTAFLPDPLTLVYSFTDGVDGYNPAGTAQGIGVYSNFYGSTTHGGTNDDGTLFTITPQGTFSNLWQFNYDIDGSGPSGLVQGNSALGTTNGYFYGVTKEGGPGGEGTVFAITPGGSLTNLYAFNGTQGSYPAALTQGRDGNFYGITYFGGVSNSGVIFMISSNINSVAFTILHAFTGGTNGVAPDTTLVQGSGGDTSFYGATGNGGTNFGCLGGCGTFFKITTNGALTTLYDFNSTDGGGAEGALALGTNGLIYGTCFTGGSNGCGTAFSISSLRNL